MKVSNLLTGLEDPLPQDLILQNALKEIDRLEKRVKYLTNAVRGADKLISRICKDAEINYSELLKKNRMYISIAFTEDSPEYDFLKWSLDLKEPEKKEEEDKNNDTV